MRFIDADSLKIETVGICDNSGNYYGAADVVFAEDIVNAPTIDPWKHGEITYAIQTIDDAGHKAKFWYCSACGHKFDGLVMNYCPQCGTRMERQRK